MAFKFEPQKIPDLVLITPDVYEDDRGFFCETYKESFFKEGGLTPQFVQDNCSFSKKGVLRGMHYQIKPKEHGKLVQVTQGKIFDVAIDIRKKSKTYGEWVGVELSSENKQMLWVPPGFAHGFLALEDSLVTYKITEEYSPEHDRSMAWDDKTVNITWPVTPQHISEKDQKAPSFSEADNNFEE